MKCMLLTAGRGNRLRPLTVRRAKPVMPLVDRPLVVHTLERLAAAGVTEVFMNLHHLPETVRVTVEHNLPPGVSVTFSEEPQILGTAGGLKAVEGLLAEEEHFMMVNGDCYYGFPFEPIVQAHRNRKPLATMVLRQAMPGSRFSPVGIDGEGRVTHIASVPAGGLATAVGTRTFLGVHVISRGIWRYMTRTGEYDINRHVYPQAMERGEEVFGFDVTGPWHDIGTPRRLLAATLDVLHARAGASPELPGVRIEHPVWIGPGVTVGEDTILTGSVLRPGAVVGPSCVLSRCIVMEGCRIGARSTLQDVILDADTVIPANSDLSDCAVTPWRGGEGRLRRREVIGDNVVAKFDSYEER